jgi:hypothetical protein
VKKLAIALLSCVLVLSLSSCKCSVEKQAVTQVENTHKKIAAKLLKYVDADEGIAGPKNAGESDAAYAERKKKARDDWHKLVESDQRNIDALKKAME